MAISYVGGDSHCSAIGADTTGPVTLPTVLTDDVAVLVIHSFHSADRGLPASGLTGWALRANLGSGAYSYRSMVWTKTLTAAESGTTITPTFSGGNGFTALLMVFRGVETVGSPVDVVSSQAKAIGSSTATFNSLTTTEAGSMVIATVAAKDPITQAGGFLPPSGFTQAVDAAGTDQFRNAAGFYALRASAGAGAPGNSTLGLSSDWATLSIALLDGVPPPAPTVSNPADLTVEEGESGSLTVTATDATSVQWYRGASGVTTTPVVGATSLTFTQTWGLSEGGSYWVRVSNVTGSDDSAAATVTVTPAPPTTSPPANLTVVSGAMGTISTTSTGATSWQWFRGASGVTTTPVVGAVGSALTKPWYSGDAGSYWVRVTGPTGTVDSAACTVSISVGATEIGIVGSDEECSALGGDRWMEVTFPTGIEYGDVAVLYIATLEAADYGLPVGGLDGWTLHQNVGGGSWSWRSMLWSKTVGPAESGQTLRVTFSGPTGWSVHLVVLEGVDSADPVSAISQKRAIGSSSVTFDAVTVAEADSTVLTFISAKDPIVQVGGFVPPSGFTELEDSSSDANQYRNAGSAYKHDQGTGSFTPGSSSLGRTTDWTATAVVIRPGDAVAAGPGPEPGGFPAIVSTADPGIDFRTGPSAEHLELIRSGVGGVWSLAIELIDTLTDSPIFSTVARPEDEAEWWAAEPSREFVFEGGRSSQRSVSLMIPIEGPLPGRSRLLPTGNGHPLHAATQNQIRIWAGHELSDRIELIPIGTFVVDDAEVVDDAGAVYLSVSGTDLVSLVDAAFLSGGLTISEGQNIVETVVEVLEEVLPDMAVIKHETAAFTFPEYEADEGSSVLAFIDEALAAVGKELTTDELGRFQIAEVPQTFAARNDPADWIYGDGGIPVETVRVRFSIPDTPSGLKLNGGTLGDPEAEAQVSVTIHDQDPTSLTFWDSSNPPPWSFVKEISNDFVVTDSQAKIAAWAAFRRAGQGGQIVEFTAIPNPALRAGQSVEFFHDHLGVGGSLWKVVSVSLPILSDALMTVTIARSWDPALEDSEIGSEDRPGVGITTASDDFDYGTDYFGKLPGASRRSYLYEFPGWGPHTGGSDTVYPELDYVLGGNGHGFGRWSTQMDSTDQFAELEIVGLLPNAKGVGPIVRCDRTGPDIIGYCPAVVRNGGANNKIELRRWDGKYDNQTIGTYIHGSTLVGTVVRVEAVGSTITVKVDGTEVLEVSDSRHSGGRYVGFVICGSRARAWEAGVI